MAQHTAMLLSMLSVGLVACAGAQRAGDAHCTSATDAPSAAKEPAIWKLTPQTRITAKLANSIDGTTPKTVEATITRPVLDSDGLLVAPTGSRMVCEWSRAEKGRIDLDCEIIRTAKGEFTFSSIYALADDGHTGLPIVAGVVQAGTPFLVFAKTRENPRVLWR